MKNQADTADKIGALRRSMAEHGLDAYVVPNTDPHHSEYVAEHWRCRRWLTGFTGSAGTAAVLAEKAGLWTDGRYFIQAEKELAGSGIDLFRMQQPGVPELIDWLCEEIPAGGALGIDGRQLTAETAGKWLEKLGKKKIRLVTDLDLVSMLWADRPPVPDAPVAVHAAEVAGRTVAQNLAEIRAAMEKAGADAYLISSLYDIAWLCNIRGGDIPFCPVAMAYVLLKPETAELFIDLAKTPVAVGDELARSGVALRPYEGIADALRGLAAGTRIFLDERRVNIFLKQQIPGHCAVVNGKELTELPKARKNATQLRHWREVQKLDGAAMVRFWMWLEAQVPLRGVTECEASSRLAALRRAHPACLDLSFATIAGYGPNAAMMHYFPVPETCATLEPRGLFLIDSGGQYLGGTTDITRTMALGALTDEQRTDYTLVLKGVANLSTAVFLESTSGLQLDILARQPLWRHGIDYKCGTGHGVGYYLNVHEGPQNLSQHQKSGTALEPGMILTIEPGVYKQDRHGIRIENMGCVEEAMKTESGTFLRFETLTLCPIDTSPLVLELLEDREIEWLNGYHAAVREKLSPLLDPEERRWLEAKTAAIAKP